MSKKPSPTPTDNGEGDVDFVSVDDLLGQDVLYETVKIEGMGSVELKGLTRDEAHKVVDIDDVRKREISMVTWGMSKPNMTYQQVEKWFRSAPAGQLQMVTEVISRLSGLDDDAEREAVQRF